VDILKRNVSPFESAKNSERKARNRISQAELDGRYFPADTWKEAFRVAKQKFDQLVELASSKKDQRYFTPLHMLRAEGALLMLLCGYVTFQRSGVWQSLAIGQTLRFKDADKKIVQVLRKCISTIDGKNKIEFKLDLEALNRVKYISHAPQKEQKAINTKSVQLRGRSIGFPKEAVTLVKSYLLHIRPQHTLTRHFFLNKDYNACSSETLLNMLRNVVGDVFKTKITLIDLRFAHTALVGNMAMQNDIQVVQQNGGAFKSDAKSTQAARLDYLLDHGEQVVVKNYTAYRIDEDWETNQETEPALKELLPETVRERERKKEM
jgi:hypothetical protein